MWTQVWHDNNLPRIEHTSKHQNSDSNSSISRVVEAIWELYPNNHHKQL